MGATQHFCQPAEADRAQRSLLLRKWIEIVQRLIEVIFKIKRYVMRSLRVKYRAVTAEMCAPGVRFIDTLKYYYMIHDGSDIGYYLFYSIYPGDEHNRDKEKIFIDMTIPFPMYYQVV